MRILLMATDARAPTDATAAGKRVVLPELHRARHREPLRVADPRVGHLDLQPGPEHCTGVRTGGLEGQQPERHGR